MELCSEVVPIAHPRAILDDIAAIVVQEVRQRRCDAAGAEVRAVSSDCNVSSCARCTKGYVTKEGQPPGCGTAVRPVALPFDELSAPLPDDDHLRRGLSRILGLQGQARESVGGQKEKAPHALAVRSLVGAGSPAEARTLEVDSFVEVGSRVAQGRERAALDTT